uniref:Uncharacterized protein n=1 Tax=Rhizophora mucronata TaxID=61149 RepID=A0A2P2KRU6_RHIMU
MLIYRFTQWFVVHFRSIIRIVWKVSFVSLLWILVHILYFVCFCEFKYISTSSIFGAN